MALVEDRLREAVRLPEFDTPQQSSVDLVEAVEIIRNRCAARAITFLSNPRQLPDGRTIYPRLSANDCFVAMAEACKKMARVALKRRQTDPTLAGLAFGLALEAIFPDPTAYLARCIRSVVSDAERLARREPATVSLDQPISSCGPDGAILLRDTLHDDDEASQPDAEVLDRCDKSEFRTALSKALGAIPANYLAALRRDIARDRELNAGAKLAPESDRDRQTVCRARAALSALVLKECGPDNPFARIVAQQRSGRVRQKSSPSQQWTAERQNTLLRKLMETPWADRKPSAGHDANVDEAIVNDVSEAGAVAPPSPELRRMMRVMDTYTLNDNPATDNAEAMELYDAAKRIRREKGDLNEAIRLYRAAYDLDNRFYAANNEVAVLLSQQGNLRDALRIYLKIVEDPNAGDDRYMAATNASDIYLTWFDAGRNRETNIEQATRYALIAMQKPTPMRACNLLMAYVKDRYYIEARQTLETVMRDDLPGCPAERFLQTLFQIRDADLVSWWGWLDEELGKD